MISAANLIELFRIQNALELSIKNFGGIQLRNRLHVNEYYYLSMHWFKLSVIADVVPTAVHPNRKCHRDARGQLVS